MLGAKSLSWLSDPAEAVTVTWPQVTHDSPTGSITGRPWTRKGLRLTGWPWTPGCAILEFSLSSVKRLLSRILEYGCEWSRWTILEKRINYILLKLSNPPLSLNSEQILGRSLRRWGKGRETFCRTDVSGSWRPPLCPGCCQMFPLQASCAACLRGQ